MFPSSLYLRLKRKGKEQKELSAKHLQTIIYWIRYLLNVFTKLKPHADPAVTRKNKTQAAHSHTHHVYAYYSFFFCCKYLSRTSTLRGRKSCAAVFVREERQKQAQTLEKALNEIHTIERTQFRRETPSWVRTLMWS